MALLSRIGYGSEFNNLYIFGDSIKKESKNEYGLFKIKKELEFYKYVINNNIPLSVPDIYEFGSNYYTMKYYEDYVPLYKVFPSVSFEKKVYILNKIYKSLHDLHLCSKQDVDKEVYTKHLYVETKTKILKRYKELEFIEKYNFIKRVNNVQLKSFKDILAIIERRVQEFIESKTSYNLCVIHGDCQFNNILYNIQSDDIKFIDPRGYFGDSELYGIYEYDLAKIRFALSGYDIFDNMNITSLEIQDDNLMLPDIKLFSNIFQTDIITVLTISIWLGNAHCFKNNIPKAIFSFYYALYLGSLYL